MPRSVNGDEWWFGIGFRKLPVFREAVKPRLVGGDRSHGATFFTEKILLIVFLNGPVSSIYFGLFYSITSQFFHTSPWEFYLKVFTSPVPA